MQAFCRLDGRLVSFYALRHNRYRVPMMLEHMPLWCRSDEAQNVWIDMLRGLGMGERQSLNFAWSISPILSHDRINPANQNMSMAGNPMPPEPHPRQPTNHFMLFAQAGELSANRPYALTRQGGDSRQCAQLRYFVLGDLLPIYHSPSIHHSASRTVSSSYYDHTLFLYTYTRILYASSDSHPSHWPSKSIRPRCMNYWSLLDANTETLHWPHAESTCGTGTHFVQNPGYHSILCFPVCKPARPVCVGYLGDNRVSFQIHPESV